MKMNWYTTRNMLSNEKKNTNHIDKTGKTFNNSICVYSQIYGFLFMTFKIETSKRVYDKSINKLRNSSEAWKTLQILCHIFFLFCLCFFLFIFAYMEYFITFPFQLFFTTLFSFFSGFEQKYFGYPTFSKWKVRA